MVFRLTLKLIKQLFSEIDKETYDNYIKNSIQKKGTLINFVITDKTTDSSAVRIKKKSHYIYINPNVFADKKNPKEYLKKLLQSESVIIALDIFYGVKKNADRPYDIFGLRRKCVSMELFGEYLYNDRIPSSESVWFETGGIIQEGKVIRNIKDKQLTVIKAKDDTEHTISDDLIFGTSRDDFFVK